MGRFRACARRSVYVRKPCFIVEVECHDRDFFDSCDVRAVHAAGRPAFAGELAGVLPCRAYDRTNGGLRHQD